MRLLLFLLIFILTLTNATAQENQKSNEYPTDISTLEKRISFLEKREKYRTQCINSFDFKELFNAASLGWRNKFFEQADNLKKCISDDN